MALQLTSTAFREGEMIPKRYTRDGENISPPLKWLDPPKGTESLALICDDPDAPRKVWTHWLVYNIPAESRELAEGVPPVEMLPNGTLQGKNDFDKIGYGGPAPPAGPPHRYFLKLYALDLRLEEDELAAGATRDELIEAIDGHVLESSQLMGLYGT